MCKNLTLLILIIFANSAYSQLNDRDAEQINPPSLSCSYWLTYQPDSANSQDLLSEEMILFIENSRSKFQSYNSYIFDSIMQNFKNATVTSNNISTALSSVQAYKTRFKFQIFKNYPTGKITTTDRILTDDYQYEETKDLFHWEILDKTDSIAGYHCQKALTEFAGRKYEAWFTTEIPISEGPYKFNGLPGLIVKIADTRNHYIFELIRVVNNKSQTNIDIPNKVFIRTTKKEFEKGSKEFMENVVDRIAQAGFTLNSEEDKNEVMAKTKKRNNPIELNK